MEIIEQIGFIHYWGLSPSLNLLDDNADDDNIKILLTGVSDIRHILKTIADNC